MEADDIGDMAEQISVKFPGAIFSTSRNKHEWRTVHE